MLMLSVSSAMQTIKVTKTINAPLRYVFNWCTDFREDDPALTNSKGSRKILEKTKKRVVYTHWIRKRMAPKK